MTRATVWEYHVERTHRLDADQLNSLGKDGWELVAISPDNRAIFKRPGPDYRERITREQRARVEREFRGGST